MKKQLTKFALVIAISSGVVVAHAAYRKRFLATANNARSGSVEELREDLYGPTGVTAKEVKKAKVLKTAWTQLQNQNYAKAKTTAGAMRTDQTLGDYARWMMAEATLGQARQALEAKKYAEAKSLSSQTIGFILPIEAIYPYSAVNRLTPRTLSEAELIMGRSDAAAKKWASAKQHFENGFERLITPSEIPFIRPADLGAYAEACAKEHTEFCESWVLRLAQSYPRVSLEFKQLVKFFPQYANKVPKTPYYGKLVQIYRGPELDQVAFDAAMAPCLDHKYSDAVQKLRSFLDEFPRSQYRYRASYWLGQSLIKEKKEAEGKKVLNDLRQSSPLTYYGLLAAIATGNDFTAPIQTSLPSAYDSDPFLQPQELLRLRRAKILIAAKAYELAAIELKTLKSRDGLSSPFLIYLAMLHGEAQSYSTAYPIINELVNRGYNDALTSFISKIIFPIPQFQLIKKYSAEAQIDPVLVLSLIKQESAFEPSAISGSGALGMMQLMPATAIAVDGSIERFDLLSSEKNIHTGTRYLAGLLNRFNGNTVLAVAAYNAGPGAVSRWLKAAPPGWTMLEFIESIPYKETREYVAAIIRNYYWYAKKLDPQGAKNLTLERFWNKPTQQLISTNMENEEAPVPTAPDETMGPPEPTLSPSTAPNVSPAPSPSPTVKPSPAPASTPTPTPVEESSPEPAALPVHDLVAPSPSSSATAGPSPSPSH